MGIALLKNLLSPFTSARLTLRFENAGDRVVLDIDTDFNGTPDQSYFKDGVLGLAPNFGTGFGIGAFGNARFDNWQVSGGQTCYPDCDGSGTLDLFDFLCFVNKFNSGDPYADCDGNQSLDLFDFLCFVNKFNAGCP